MPTNRTDDFLALGFDYHHSKIYPRSKIMLLEPDPGLIIYYRVATGGYTIGYFDTEDQAKAAIVQLTLYLELNP